FPVTGRRVRMPTLLPLWRATRTTGKQCGLTATGDYQPSLRSPWLAAWERELGRILAQIKGPLSKSLAIAIYSAWTISAFKI
ncbi:MAG: hypothetical protein RPU72_05545, partial [Candidatus Sedimenticola sp. (ex Thyasira tokunagai)]